MDNILKNQAKLNVLRPSRQSDEKQERGFDGVFRAIQKNYNNNEHAV
jgi:hypothetical protein